MSKDLLNDPILKDLVEELVKEHKCHMVMLYGSRAKGFATKYSDYDVLGVRSTGKKYRLARKQKGFYLDVFVFPEKDLKKVDENHLYMAGGKLLLDKKKFGANLLRRLKTESKKKFVPIPQEEILVKQVWLHKMLERVQVGDIEGNYRRSWLQEALLYDYFEIRKKRAWGSKQNFNWLKDNDPQTYKLFEQSLANPTDYDALTKLVERVSRLTKDELLRLK